MKVGTIFEIYGIVGDESYNGWVGIVNTREKTENGSRSISRELTGDTFETFKAGDRWCAKKNREVAIKHGLC